MSFPDDLLAAAEAARANAHAPYSGFRVGAAVRSAAGTIHAGCNVENAAYPEGTCAEAGALAAMVAANGAQALAEVLILAGGAEPASPCGGCRQKLAEFGAPDTPVHLVASDGEARVVTQLGALLPGAFSARNMEDGPDGL